MFIEIDKENSLIKTVCDNCNKVYSTPYEKGKHIDFMEEFGEYENYKLEPCPHCQSFTIVNLNIPMENLEESFFEEHQVNEAERQQRRVIKELYGELNFENK